MANYGDYQETTSQVDVVRRAINTGEWGLEELSIELSNKCLVRCIHCSSGSQPKPMKDELTFEDHVRLMQEARALGAHVLSMSGGDPILVPNLPEYVEMAINMGYEKVLLYTTGVWAVNLDHVDGRSNGTGHTVPVDDLAVLAGGWQFEQWGLAGIETYPQLDKLLAFKDRGLIFVFSLHSHDASTNDYIMKLPGSFRMITGGIKMLTSKGVSVWTHFVPMQPNAKHISKTRDLCVQLGVEKMSLDRKSVV